MDKKTSKFTLTKEKRINASPKIENMNNNSTSNEDTSSESGERKYKGIDKKRGLFSFTEEKKKKKCQSKDGQQE
jgi:hypothetical protein